MQFFIYRFLVPFLQPCAVLAAHVQADLYRVNNFLVVQVSAAQNRPQGRDDAELTISQHHGLGVVENGKSKDVSQKSTESKNRDRQFSFWSGFMEQM
jgi:hypothetical protein